MLLDREAELHRLEQAVNARSDETTKQMHVNEIRAIKARTAAQEARREYHDLTRRCQQQQQLLRQQQLQGPNVVNVTGTTRVQPGPSNVGGQGEQNSFLPNHNLKPCSCIGLLSLHLVIFINLPKNYSKESIFFVISGPSSPPLRRSTRSRSRTVPPKTASNSRKRRADEDEDGSDGSDSTSIASEAKKQRSKTRSPRKKR